ncbi:hypothetical protein [uncultured Albimonas sp.]|mgnify:FL=1|uniref:hypothetical protein n=1 Tax=uncultured Albimonas sp. TaxID=1331701 RepID=UPI0030EBB8EF
MAIFTLAERSVDLRLDDIVERFTDSPLVARRDMPEMAARLAEALRRRDSRVAELVTAAIALGLGVFTLVNTTSPEGGAWYARPATEGGGATVAGIWAALVSVTVFAFLVLRWLRALVIWGLLLRRVAGLELRLSLFHPDGYGGLGFLGRYPNVFALHVFAISCVLGAALMRQVLAGTAEPTVFVAVMGSWLAVVMALFGLPLLAFFPPLSALKKTAMEAASALATHHGREDERKVLGDNCAAPGAADEVDGAPDPGKLYAAARKLGTLPFARAALVPIGAAALLPLAAAGAAELPLEEVFKVAKKLLLL